MPCPLAALISVLTTTAAFAQRDSAPWTVDHCAHLGPMLPAMVCTQGEHEYGSTTVFDNGGGQTWTMSSPSPNVWPQFDRTVFCNFTGYNLYWKSDIAIDGIEPPVLPGSVRLINEAGHVIGTGSATATGLTASFFTTELPPIFSQFVEIAWADAPACYVDCNFDGAATLADFGCFQTKFALGHMYADCNLSGTWTMADFGCFQLKYVLGCP